MTYKVTIDDGSLTLETSDNGGVSYDTPYVIEQTDIDIENMYWISFAGAQFYTSGSQQITNFRVN